MPADGIRFGSYLLLRRIARGGMAEVFAAQQRGLEGFDRRVAVKRILPHLADAPDFVKMFLGEAKLAAQLSHPNIVHIYDFGKVDHDYFLAMEYVEGVHAGQIYKLGEASGPVISPTLVARIGADAAAALHYAHELEGPNHKPLGLVHRDVSPANIMVSYDGVVKLCDFGIAKAMAASEQLTNPGQVKGKYAYMSPEQTVAAALDGRSDVFSLSIVMWELLAGKHIVPRGDAVDAMRAIRDGRLPTLASVAPKLPRALADAVSWGLETRRERRATAAELHGALESFIKQSPELATPMQLAHWLRTHMPRETSGAQAAVNESRHTSVATPQTQVAKGTVAGTASAASVTPSSAVAPGFTSIGDDTGTLLEPDTYDTSETVMLSESAARHHAIASRASAELRAAEEPTHRDPLHLMAESGETIVPAPVANQLGRPPTIPPISPSGRGSRKAVPMTRLHARLTTPTEAARDLLPRAARSPRVRLIAGLAAIAIASFVIALAARSCASGEVVVDSALVVVPIDTEPLHDAVASDTAATDAAVPPTSSYLEITTTPTGATVTVGDQRRIAPASFVVAAGHYEIVAELDGWQPERRTIDVEAREHRTAEIAFTKRTPPPIVPQEPKKELGTLSVRTRPYSDVFHGTRKLGQSPFELMLPAGTYSLVFRNPAYPAITKVVTIAPGKATKLTFDLK